MSWRWLRDDVLITVHEEQILEHGGAEGIRDRGLLSSALMRPQNIESYIKPKPSVFDLAAAYAAGVIHNHPFVDGNKRTGFLAAYIFLALNGWELVAAEADAVVVILDLAANDIDEAQFSVWLKNNSKKSNE